MKVWVCTTRTNDRHRVLGVFTNKAGADERALHVARNLGLSMHVYEIETDIVYDPPEISSYYYGNWGEKGPLPIKGNIE